MNTYYFLIIVLCSLMACGQKATQNTPSQATNKEASIETVDALTFKKYIDNNTGIVLDVRTPEEVASGQIGNASTIDFYDPQFVNKLNVMAKDKPILVYCKSGGRSAEAAQILQQNGFDKIYNLDGGIMSWQENKLPITAPTTNNNHDAKIQAMPLVEFEALLKKTEPILVDFHTTWCAPCRKMAPVIDELQKKYENKATVVRIDVDKSKELAEKYQIKGVPVFILFKNGVAAWKHQGIIDAQIIAQQIDSKL